MSHNFVKSPKLDWLSQFVNPGILTTPGYHLDKFEVPTKLDQNESPMDWPHEIKEKVVGKLLNLPWNRYTPPFPEELTRQLAQYLNVDEKNLLLSPGSNHLIALVLTLFSRGKSGKVIGVSPSFPLFESHCRSLDIPFERWQMTKDFEFDLKNIPKVDAGSLVIFASPNNPTGTVLQTSQLEELLATYPSALFVADEAYYEFTDQNYLSLQKNYDNLIIIRTFSKTMATAAIRLGYLIGAESYIELLKKLMLPYIVNLFTFVAVEELLKDPKAVSHMLSVVDHAKIEREFVFSELQKIKAEKKLFIKPSQANFLLVRWQNNEWAQKAYLALIDHGIIVRNISKGPGLAGCLRISMGTREENLKLIGVIQSLC